MLSVALAVSAHMHILVTTYYLCACQTKYSPMKHVKCVKYTHVCVNKIHKCISCKPKMHAVRTSHDAQAVDSCVHVCSWHAFYVINLSSTHRLCCKHFQKHVVVTCVCVWSSLNWAVLYYAYDVVRFLHFWLLQMFICNMYIVHTSVGVKPNSRIDYNVNKYGWSKARI